MPGLTVIPGQDPYRGLSQALTMGIQGWDRNQQQQQLAQQLGPNNPLSRLVPFLSPQQMAMLQGQQNIWQQQNPLAGQQAQVQLGLTGAQTELAQARTAGLQQGGGLTRPQIISQLNKLRDQKIQIEAAVSGGRMSRSSARQKLANITRQEQQITDLLSGTPQRQQQGGIRGLINSLLGGPQQRQVQPQIELLAPKAEKLTTDKTTANYWTKRFGVSAKDAAKMAKDAADIAAGFAPRAAGKQTALDMLAKWQTVKVKTRDPTWGQILKGEEETAALADKMIAHYRGVLQSQPSADTGVLQSQLGTDSWESAARAVDISQNDAYFLINPVGSSAQERKSIQDKIAKARKLGHSYTDILEALNKKTVSK